MHQANFLEHTLSLTFSTYLKLMYMRAGIWLQLTLAKIPVSHINMWFCLLVPASCLCKPQEAAGDDLSDLVAATYSGDLGCIGASSFHLKFSSYQFRGFGKWISIWKKSVCLSLVLRKNSVSILLKKYWLNWAEMNTEHLYLLALEIFSCGFVV